MHDQLAEKFSELFAKCAATGDTAELRKEAAAHNLVKEAVNPLLAGAIGAVGGGGAGYLGTEKKKNKMRNALYGALTGGLGSAGGALLLNSAPGLAAATGLAPVNSADPPIARGPDGKPIPPPMQRYDKNTPGNPLTAVRAKADALGAIGGATFANGLLKRVFPNLGRGGELQRLIADAAKNPGKYKDAPYLAGLKQFFGDPAKYTAALPRADAPAAARITDTGSLSTNRLSSEADRNNMRRALGRILNVTPANSGTPAQGVPGRKGYKPAKPPTGGTAVDTLLGDLNNNRAGGRRRWAARGAGGLLGGVGTDLLIRALQNAITSGVTPQQK
jgi:hypothetical protein